MLFLFYAPLHGSNLYDFHYLPFAPFFLWTTLALLEARRDRWAAVAIVLTLANREDMSALLIVVGVYLLLTGERPRAGLVVAAIGAVYFVVVKFILMPHFLGGCDRLRPPVQGPGPRRASNGFGGVLKTVFGNPGYTATTPARAGQGPLPAADHGAARLLPLAAADRPAVLAARLLLHDAGDAVPAADAARVPVHRLLDQLPVPRRGREPALAEPRRGGRARPAAAAEVRASRRAWQVAMAAATLVTCYQLGPVFQQQHVLGRLPAVARRHQRPPTALRHANLYALIDQIPPDASVAASEMLVAQVSSRKNAYTLQHRPLRRGLHPGPASRPAGDDREHLIAALRTGAYGLVAEKGEFVLFRRGAPSRHGRAVLASDRRLTPEFPIN